MNFATMMKGNTATLAGSILKAVFADFAGNFDQAFAELKTHVNLQLEGDYDGKSATLKLLNRIPLMDIALQPGEAATLTVGKHRFIAVGSDMGKVHVIAKGVYGLLMVANAGRRFGDFMPEERRFIECTTPGAMQLLIGQVNGLRAGVENLVSIVRDSLPTQETVAEAAPAPAAQAEDVTITTAPAASPAPAGAPATVSVTPVATVMNLDETGAAARTAELDELAGKGHAVVISRGQVHQPGPVTAPADAPDITK